MKRLPILVLALLCHATIAQTSSPTPVSPAASEPWCHGELTVGEQGETCKQPDIQGHQTQTPDGEKCPGGSVDEIWIDREFFLGCWGISK